MLIKVYSLIKGSRRLRQKGFRPARRGSISCQSPAEKWRHLLTIYVMVCLVMKRPRNSRDHSEVYEIIAIFGIWGHNIGAC